jgi:hypothetical protein
MAHAKLLPNIVNEAAESAQLKTETTKRKAEE